MLGTKLIDLVTGYLIFRQAQASFKIARGHFLAICFHKDFDQFEKVLLLSIVAPKFRAS